MTSCTWLEGRITKFWETLPPLYHFYADSATARTLVVAHAMTAAAAIKLHHAPASTNTEAQTKCISAARAIITCLGDSHIPDLTTAHPIVGSLCTLACRILIDEVRKVQMFRGAWGESLGVPLPPPGLEEAALIAELKNGIATMRMYAVGSPLIGTSLIFLQNFSY